MKKKILLVEPAYQTKYPPLGLMKISTYHKSLGDDVTFVKGRRSEVLYQYWDRVYISTLFTWTWKETIETIKFYRYTLFNYAKKCYVGGILASLLPDELFDETGIQPVEGLLDDPKKIDQDDDIIIDNLPPDYELLDQAKKKGFIYSNNDAYMGYTTRGCIRKCKFCAVRRFEPEYNPYVDIKKTVEGIIQSTHEEKQHLVLMDNNVLASPMFDTIIDDIISLHFEKGAKLGPTKRKRTVDYNQGLDARLLDEHKMQRLSEICLEPMRIAFDDIKLKPAYLKAVRLAHNYGQKDMSNYILYNFKDTPEDFYERLRINIDLNDEFKNSEVKTSIYSFPMRYIPLDAKERDLDTGNKYWNKRYLRSVQVILNVMKGPVMPGKEFFLQAFGRDPEEFKAIASMPDDFIRNRLVNNWKEIPNLEARWTPYVKEWMISYFSLTSSEKENLTAIIGPNDKVRLAELYSCTNGTLKRMLELHLKEEAIVSDYKNREIGK